MNAKIESAAIEPRDEKAPVTTPSDPDRLAEVTTDELDKVEGGRGTLPYDSLGTRTGGGYFFKR
jgi:hypothetical protein